jgi:hypothetical protein
MIRIDDGLTTAETARNSMILLAHCWTTQLTRPRVNGRASKETRLNPAPIWFECPSGYFPY